MRSPCYLGRVGFLKRKGEVRFRNIEIKELLPEKAIGAAANNDGLAAARPAQRAEENGKPKLAVLAEAPSKPPPAKDAFQPGSVWKGTYTRRASDNPNEGREPAVLTVLERDGKTFKARFEIQAGENTQDREVTGTIGKGVIRWFAKDVKVLGGPKGHQGQDHVGKMRGRHIDLSYSGTAIYNSGVTVRGEVRLELDTH
ncbi:MAG TPA: hypothetical protein VK395_05790 [Gemmataceae bacterium]|nr:hypothetical protein [Gemmataceae bacterium]